ncbi:MAG: hypothetical protein ACTSRK_04605 [Promethearchaeota archaeon]
MSSVQSSKSKRGFLVLVFFTATILTLVLASVLINTANFDNSRINDTYSGTISLTNEETVYLNITFDGQGHLNGSILFENETRDFENMEYVCFQSQVEFSIYFFNETESIDFIFVGDISDSNDLIGGTAQYSKNDTDFKHGNYYLSRIS